MTRMIVIVHNDEFLTTESVEVPDDMTDEEYADLRAAKHPDND